MILIRPPGPRDWRGRYIMEWNRWLSLSATDRERFKRNPLWEQEQWFLTHGRPRPGTHAYGKVTADWNRRGRPLSIPVGFGHHFQRGENGCSGYVYWVQRSFDIDAQLARGPRQPDGFVIAELYGYKLPRRDPYLDGEFVVLRYRICRGPVRADGTCP